MISEKEKNVIGDFLNVRFINQQEGKVVYKFKFKNGDVIIVKYDCDVDSDNGLELDDPNYEEYHEFYFQVLQVEKKAKDSMWRKGKCIALNYHNFPISFELIEN